MDFFGRLLGFGSSSPETDFVNMQPVAPRRQGRRGSFSEDPQLAAEQQARAAAVTAQQSERNAQYAEDMTRNNFHRRLRNERNARQRELNEYNQERAAAQGSINQQRARDAAKASMMEHIRYEKRRLGSIPLSDLMLQSIAADYYSQFMGVSRINPTHVPADFMDAALRAAQEGGSKYRKTRKALGKSRRRRASRRN